MLTHDVPDANNIDRLRFFIVDRGIQRNRRERSRDNGDREIIRVLVDGGRVKV